MRTPILRGCFWTAVALICLGACADHRFFRPLASLGAVAINATPPGGLMADGVDGADVTVIVTTDEEEPAAGLAVELRLESDDTGVTLMQPSAPTDANGRTAGKVSSTQIGTVQLRAIVEPDSAEPLTSAIVTVDFVAGPFSPGNSTIEANPDLVVADGQETSTITVTARDTRNRPMVGLNVVVRADQGLPGMTLTQPSAATDPVGVATGSVSSTDVGVVRFRAAVADIDIEGSAQVRFHSGRPPEVVEPARYIANRRNFVEEGTLRVPTKLVVPFDRPVIVDGGLDPDVAFALPVQSDSFGTSRSDVRVAAPTDADVEFDIAAGTRLKTRQDFAAANVTPNAASGIALSPTVPAGAIRDAVAGLNAVAGPPVDIIPGYNAVPLALAEFGGPKNAIAAADIDRDGQTDLVFGRRAGEQSAILVLQNRFGFYRPMGEFGSGNTQALAIGDLDEDGDLDIVAGNGDSAAGTSQPDFIWRNDGSGQMLIGRSLGDQVTQALALADVDCDGDLDVIAGSSVTTVLYVNQEPDGFQEVPLEANGNVVDLEVLDFNCDGQPDIAVARAGDTNLVLINDRGRFPIAAMIPFGDAADPTTSLAVGDLALDGKVDIVEGNGPRVPDRIWPNLGGRFGPPATPFGDGDTTELAVDDYDDDGDPDVFLIRQREPSLLWLNRRGGRFLGSRQPLPAETSLDAVVFDDDDDGDRELVIMTDDESRVFENGLAETWGTVTYVDAGLRFDPDLETADVELGDLDCDGDLDLVEIAAESGGAAAFAWLWDDDAGEYTTRIDLPLTGFPRQLELADVDCNGTLDVITADSGTLISVILNNGDRTFAEGPTFSLANSRDALIEVGDLNGDGRPDVVAASRAGQNEVFINRLALGGGFSFAATFGKNLSTALALADIDRDGDLDILEGSENNAEAGDVFVYFNDALTFTRARMLPDSAGAIQPTSIATADVNHDGWLDVVVGYRLRQLSVWLSDADSGFGAPTRLGSTGTFNVDLGLRDVNGDGYADILDAHAGGANLVWMNNGSGAFRDPTQDLMFGASGTTSMTSGDIDRDGDVDIIIGRTGEGAAPNQVFVNH